MIEVLTAIVAMCGAVFVIEMLYRSGLWLYAKFRRGRLYGNSHTRKRIW